jgi:hypothetical protein
MLLAFALLPAPGLPRAERVVAEYASTFAHLGVGTRPALLGDTLDART